MKFVMKSKSLIFACFVVLALATAGMASGTGGNDDCKDSPAQNERACHKAGGTFTREDSLRTCVVTEESEHVTCKRPKNKPFSADISGSTITYIRDGDECTTETTEGDEILACYNGEGRPVNENACKNKRCLPKHD